jgi:uncharacterized protein YdaU (DUF1376 family)
MAKDPALLFYVSDFLTGTMFMSNEQVGIYIRLLCSQHQHGGLIDKISFKALCNGHDLIKNKFIETDDGFFNVRLMEEMEKRQIKSSNMSANAKIRWDKYMQLHSKSKTKAMQLKDKDIIKDVIKTNIKVIKYDFNIIYDQYPKKLGKKQAESHFNSSIKTDQDFENIKKALNNYLQCKQVKDGYIQNASTWFNNWQDWINYEEPKTEEDTINEFNRKCLNK